MAVAEDTRPLIRIVADVMNDFASLFQTEIRLMRTEMNEKLSRLVNSGTLIAIGAIGSIAALFLLLQALVKWLAIAGLPEEWGLLLVGLAIAVVAAALLMKGVDTLRKTALMPERSLRQMQADLTTIKEHVS